MAEKRGRKTKLDKDHTDRMVAALRAGNFRQVACEYSGLDYSTVVRWMRLGTQRPNTPYGEFRRAVLEAERHAEVNCVARVMKAAEKDWKAAAWWLERKRNDRWSRKEKLEHTGSKGGPITAQVKVLKELSDADLEAVEAIIKRATSAGTPSVPAAEAPVQAAAREAEAPEAGAPPEPG